MHQDFEKTSIDQLWSHAFFQPVTVARKMGDSGQVWVMSFLWPRRVGLTSWSTWHGLPTTGLLLPREWAQVLGLHLYKETFPNANATKGCVLPDSSEHSLASSLVPVNINPTHWPHWKLIDPWKLAHKSNPAQNWLPIIWHCYGYYITSMHWGSSSLCHRIQGLYEDIGICT